jgi:CRISPR-associated protein Csa3
MAKAIVASFGFDEKFVVRAILRHGLSTGDMVVLVTGKLVERVVKAYESVKKLTRQAGAEVRICELEVHDFPKIVPLLRDYLKELAQSFDTVVLVLSGGMRVIVLALFTAALLLPGNAKSRFRVELETEDQGLPVSISSNVLRLFATPSLDAKQDLLNVVVSRPGLTVAEMQDIVNKHESTIRRQLKQLEAMGLIKLREAGTRGVRAWPTDAGYILASSPATLKCSS